MSFKPITTLGGTVDLGITPETRVLEFKSEYRWQKAKGNQADREGQAEELARDVAQFANTDGGTLLIGITERDAGNGRKVADALAPITEIDGFKQWVAQAVRNYLTPATFTHTLDPVSVSGGSVLAVNIPPSLHLIAHWASDGKKGIEYLYRTDHGKEWMNPDEVERHIMNGSRAMQIELSRVLDEVGNLGNSLPVALTPPLQVWAGRLQPVVEEHEVLVRRGACTDREIELCINVSRAQVGSVRIPHGLIRHAWRTSEGHVGLCLGVAIVHRGGSKLGLEPLPGAQ